MIFLLDSTDLNPKFRLTADIPPGGEEVRLVLRLPPWEPRTALQRQAHRRGPVYAPSPAWPHCPFLSTRHSNPDTEQASGGVTTACCHQPHYTDEETEAQSIEVHTTAKWWGQIQTHSLLQVAQIQTGTKSALGAFEGTVTHQPSRSHHLSSPKCPLQKQSVDFSIQRPTLPDSPTHSTRAA